MLSASSTKNTAWGLPTLTPTASDSGPTETGMWLVSTALSNGISRQSSQAGPISTATWPSASPRASSSPATVCTVTSRRFSSPISTSATQRVALPQAATSLPSLLRMRIKASASSSRDGSMTISWSQPTPVLRSAMRAAVASSMSRTTESRRPSKTTKSLPRPCILVKEIPFISVSLPAVKKRLQPDSITALMPGRNSGFCGGHNRHLKKTISTAY